MSTISDKIIKNTVFNTFGSIGSALLQLIIIPYMIFKLGPERFGIWALVSVLFGLFASLDFGSNSAFIKYFSEYYAKGDEDAFNQVLVSGLLFMLFFSIIIFLIFVLLINKLVLIFKIPEYLYNEASFVFLWAGVIFCFNNTVGVFQAVIKGLQRMDVSNGINIISSLFFTFSVFVLLGMGYGLRGIIAAQAIKILIMNLISIYYAKKLLGYLALRSSNLNLRQLRQILDYGVKMQISNIANLVNFQTDKTIISYFLNLSYVAFYEIGQRVYLFCQAITGALLSALVPAVSELESSGRKETIHKLYEKGNKYLLAVTFPIMTFIMVFAHLIIYFWMGPGYEHSVWVVRFLILGLLVNLLTGVGVMIVRGIGKPIYETRYGLISLTLNIVLSIILVKHYGFWGVVIASPISTIIGSLYFVTEFHKLHSIPLFYFYRKVLFKPLFISSGLAFFLYFVNTWVTKSIVLGSRIEILVLLFVDSIAFFIPYVFLLNKSHFWDSEDGLLFEEKTRAYPKIQKLVNMFV